MAILGSQNNGAYFTRDFNFELSHRLDIVSTLTYVGGHVVTEVGLWQADEPSGESTVNLSIYDISAGVNGAPLIYTKSVTTDVGTGTERYIKASGLSDALSGLSGGETLALAVGWSSGAAWKGRRVDGSSNTSSSTTSGAPPDSSWSENSVLGNEAPDAYMTIEEVGPSVSTTGTLRPDGTISYTPTNFTDPISGATFTDSNGNAITLTVNSQSELQAPALSNGANYAAFGTGTLEVTDGTDTATASVDFSAPSGWTQDVLEAGFGNTEEYWTHYASNPAAGQQFFYDPNQNGETVEFLSDGGWNSTGEGTYTLWVVDPTDGVLESTDVISGEEDAVEIVAGFTVSKDNLEATFTNTSTYDGQETLTYSWDFGDTNTSTDESPVHTYSVAGTYTVDLEVSDGTVSDTYSSNIRVGSTPFPTFIGRRYTRQLLKNQTSNIVGDWMKTSSTRDYGIVVEGVFDTATVKLEIAVVDKSGTEILTALDNDLSFTSDSGLVIKRFPKNARIRAVVESAGTNTDINFYLTI